MTHSTENARRPRCRCGVYIDCHHRITDHRPRRASRARLWFNDHSLRLHVVAPIWLRLPGKWRWAIVSQLNKSPDRCWADLVSAAMPHKEQDACDVRTPFGCSARRCNDTCDWMGGSVRHDHEGTHACSCYCGKFRFAATEGADERRASAMGDRA